ncbi:Putative F-box/kelch-repeat protein [Morus notabilis]|uniref:Putative F-box/kelch-repeat protein n=1 Tax=Morus notabilis TaxID=981085 RepID=W9RJP6_9ROSA|nr:Putative F-box/kelch-repeat protein [Morus notabilis]
MNNPEFVAKHLCNTKKKLFGLPKYSLEGTYLLTVASSDSWSPYDHIPCVTEDLKFLTSRHSLKGHSTTCVKFVFLLEVEMARFSDMPEEVLEEIMSWLPSESLKRFKCICKSWYFYINALMNNPTFVAKHLCNTKKKLVSCNGVICCYHRDYHNTKDIIFLLNPALRELKIVPDAEFGDGYEIQGVGFGYDSRANDYKVVNIKSEDQDDPYPYKAEDELVTDEEIVKDVVGSGRGHMKEVGLMIKKSVDPSTSSSSTPTYPPQQQSSPLDMQQKMNEMFNDQMQMVTALRRHFPGIDIPMPQASQMLSPPSNPIDIQQWINQIFVEFCEISGFQFVCFHP